MKYQISVFLTTVVILSSCSYSYTCPGLHGADIHAYFGEASDYGDSITFISEDGISLTYNLSYSQSLPFECQVRGGFNGKECDCEANEDIDGFAPDSIFSGFDVLYEGVGLEEGTRSLEVLVSVERTFVRINFDEGDPSEERFEDYPELDFVNDTVINGRNFSKVMVANDIYFQPGTYILLSYEEGVIGYKDKNQDVWYRKF